ncbi:hypothetical protein A4H97_11640 [Niastella yeongjuensis]|uniref:Protein FecR C-terminal domain-containing protein n=1 Tax=Niastella yeongjuensis TaxID=354355 RepID=A0A1V9E9M8_9BACT|nr:DUF4974 domain-containing protein [Niastella yeongjuensis]OQP42806.1 hypothetical protein A4H97_11640 [Niastella yeongjuensis]
MDKKKLHINEVGDNRYPEPDIPVEAAWENMQQLLLQTPAAPVRASGFKKWIGKGTAKLVIGAGLVATIFLITYITTKKPAQKAATPATYKNDSPAANDTAPTGTTAVSDTLTPNAKDKRVSLEFESTPFKNVAEHMEKEFDIKIILKGNVGERRITTRFDSVTLKQMLDVMAYTLAFEYKIDKGNKQVTISGNGRNK